MLDLFFEFEYDKDVIGVASGGADPPLGTLVRLAARLQHQHSAWIAGYDVGALSGRLAGGPLPPKSLLTAKCWPQSLSYDFVRCADETRHQPQCLAVEAVAKNNWQEEDEPTTRVEKKRLHHR